MITLIVVHSVLVDRTYGTKEYKKAPLSTAGAMLTSHLDTGNSSFGMSNYGAQVVNIELIIVKER